MQWLIVVRRVALILAAVAAAILGGPPVIDALAPDEQLDGGAVGEFVMAPFVL